MVLYSQYPTPKPVYMRKPWLLTYLIAQIAFGNPQFDRQTGSPLPKIPAATTDLKVDLATIVFKPLPPPKDNFKLPDIPPPVAYKHTLAQMEVILIDAAEQGDIKKVFERSVMLWHGLDVPQNRNVALTWLGYAAAVGYADAQFYLGSLFHYGEGVLPDTNKAIQYYQMAASQGHSRSQAGLSNIYFANRNFRYFYAWLNMAMANETYPEDLQMMKRVSNQLDTNRIRAAQNLARQLVSQYPGAYKPPAAK